MARRPNGSLWRSAAWLTSETVGLLVFLPSNYGRAVKGHAREADRVSPRCGRGSPHGEGLLRGARRFHTPSTMKTCQIESGSQRSAIRAGVLVTGPDADMIESQ